MSLASLSLWSMLLPRCVLTLALLFAAPLAAQMPEPAADPRAVQPERPTVATHAHTVAPGYLEIEAGLEGDRYATDRRAFTAPILVKVGLASHLQLNVATTGFAAADDIGQGRGLGDLNVGIKWRLLDNNPILGDFAILPAIKLPTGSLARGTGTGTTDAGVLLISSYELGPVSMDLNAGLTRVGRRDSTSASSAALWTASFGAPVIGRLSWVAELFGVQTIDGSGTPSIVEFLTGPTYLLSPSLNLDLGLITPLRGNRSNALYVGLVWNAGRLPGVAR
jgi:hypothetical protein